MTSSTAATSNARPRVPAAATGTAARRRPRHGRPAGAGGFTLIEMLVVIGIIMSLLAVLLPTVGAAWRTGVRTRMAADLQIIATGLEAYKADHQRYPVVKGQGKNPETISSFQSGPLTGSVMLGRAMIGYDNTDGNPGPGFRTRKQITQSGDTFQQGRVYGPYVPADRIKYDATTNELLDRNGKIICYYPGYPQARIAAAYVSTAWNYQDPPPNRPMFNGNDNEGVFPTKGLQVTMGDHNFNGKIDSGEAPAYTGAYLLWSPGPDGEYGPKDPEKPVSPKNRCDDVANYVRNQY